MNNRDLILAIDNGTLSLKALLFDLEGRLLAKEQVRFEPYFSRNPGWAEQDPELFWKALCRACMSMWENNSGLKDRVAGVGITTQRATVINVDGECKPLRPAILWLDQRKTLGLTLDSRLWRLLFRVTGLNRTVSYFQAEAEANWIYSHQRDVWEKTRKYLLLSGFLTHRLTGEFTDSTGCQVGYIPFDYKRLRWAGKRDWKWSCLPVKMDMLPDLVPPGQPLGYISTTASRQTGIPAGLPLIAAGADKACEVIGSGSLDPSVGCLSFGTTATINITSSRYVEPIPMLPPYPSAVPGFYTVEVQVYRGFWMVNWFREQFGYPEQKEAMERGIEPEALFEDLLKEVPPSSMGLVLQPYWTPGLKSPGPEAKGAIIGFGDVHTRAHLYRAILEGLAFALREGKERLEKRGRFSITRLMVSGGGSQSDSAMQITADVFGMAAMRPHLYETSGLGAAIDVAVGLRLHRDFPSAVKAMTRAGRVFEPDMTNYNLYDALYRQVYKKMYRRLKPLYEKIREITGYPAP